MADSQVPIASSPYQNGDPDPLARIGEIVDGRYRLLEFIGQGGMGNVYRGEHVTIRKPVALKLLHPSLANIPELRSRFEREAFAIGRISHPNCVEVSDFGELGDGSLFLAMEYLDGESAADLLDRQRPLSPEIALQIIRYVLAGLGHAHLVGIVHRDIKPENIFIVNHPAVSTFAKVLDFGIAKLVEGAEDDGGREKLTQAGITFGTPAYLSPEQALGDPADGRSDLYSVSVVLFELLTGVPPFRAGDKMELLAMHANRKPPTLAEAAPGHTFSVELEALLAKGLEKRPENRFQSAEEFIIAIDDLELFPQPPSFVDWETGSMKHLTPTPIPRAAIAPTELASSAAKARPRPWKLIGVSMLGLAVVVATLFFLLTRTRTLAEIKQAEKSEVAKEAEEHLKEGEPEEAIELLTKERSSDTDASAQLRLGHAYAHQTSYDKAVAAYGRALLLDENAVRDADLITNLRIMIDDNGPIYFEALRLLVEYAKDDEAIARLIALSSHRKLSLRKEAFEMAENLGYEDKIDKVQAFIHDLAQLPTCEERKKAVSKLRALGDTRAIKPLKNARVRRGRRNKKTRKRPNLNQCLSASARDAARFLESKPTSDVPD